MTISIETTDHHAVVKIPGRFTYEITAVFHDTVLTLFDCSYIDQVTIDFAETSYIDSAALGMLIMCVHRACNANKRFYVINATGNVKRSTDTASFDLMLDRIWGKTA